MRIRVKPSRLDLYILSEVMGPFLGGIAFFVFIFLMFQALRLAEFFILHGASGAQLGKLIALLVLTFMPLALPVAFLIAVLVGFGRLSADSELVAMKSNGFSLLRLAAPVIGLSLCVVTLSLFLNLEWVPWAERNFKNTLIKIGNTKVVSSIKEGTFTSGFFDLLIFAEKVDMQTNRLKRVFIYDDRNPKDPNTVVAQNGEIVNVKTDTELGAAAVLKLYNGSIHRNDSAQGSYQKIDFGEYNLFLQINEGELTSVLKPQMIPYRELVQRISQLSPRDYIGRELRGELWRRVAIAIAPLLFVFLGMGFGTVRTRAVRAGAALVAFVVLLGYYVLQTAATIGVQRDLLPPWLAMELPNIAVFVLASISFRRAMW
ncbi:MAG: LPS export ABC transporter permease LptF [Oligoflexia bacterium]|nr:LPS export ABC transporter permease LptF [Oligoflexia bacterium]